MKTPNITVPSSIPHFVYVRTQGTSQCCECGTLVGGVARHLASFDALVCLECHVTAECLKFEAGWIR